VAGYSACGGAVYNPFRYRGYYYDVETGWYYLQSRYYNPEWGRFLNADGYLSTGTGLMGYNMFAYCNNDPINCIDTQGNLPCLIVVALLVLTIEITKNVAINNYPGLTEPERKVAKKYPISAIKGKKARDIAEDYQKEYYPDIKDNGQNQANAF